MFINSLFLAISSSIDALGIGITYGIKDTKISFVGKVILFLILFFITIASLWFGNSIKEFFPDIIMKFLGSFILILMGIFICFQALNKNTKKEVKKNDDDFEKVYKIFIKFLGITIQIIKNPISSDLDNSKSIDAKEALFLGFALSLDSFCIGFGGSIIGVSSSLFPLFVAVFHLTFLSLGNFLGRRLYKLSHLPDNIWSVISGVLLVLIGIAKLIF